MDEREAKDQVFLHGGAFHKQFPNGRTQGKILISPQKVVFFHNNIKVLSLSKGDYTLKRGGAGNKLIFFQPQDKSFSIYTSDPAIKKVPYIAEHQELFMLVKKIQKTGIFLKVSLTLILLILLSGITTLIKTRESLIEKITLLIPSRVEKKIGDTVFAQLTLKYPVIYNTAIAENIEIISRFLFTGKKLSPIILTIHETEEANALALPGGRIIIYKGLLKHTNSADEFAAVIAHEAGHIFKKHGLKALVHTAGSFLLIKTFFGDLSGIMAVILNNSSFLLRMSYSRLMEEEADTFAINLLNSCNLPPDSLASFLENLQSNSKEYKILKYLRTHPLTEDRINKIETRSKNLTYNQQVKQKNIKLEKAYNNLKTLLLTDNNKQKEKKHENRS